MTAAERYRRRRRARRCQCGRPSRKTSIWCGECCRFVGVSARMYRMISAAARALGMTRSQIVEDALARDLLR